MSITGVYEEEGGAGPWLVVLSDNLKKWLLIIIIIINIVSQICAC